MLSLASVTRLSDGCATGKASVLRSLLKETHVHIRDTGERFMEEMDIDIFRMTTFSTNGNVDGKEGRKEHAFFRPEGSQIGPTCTV